MQYEKNIKIWLGIYKCCVFTWELNMKKLPPTALFDFSVDMFILALACDGKYIIHFYNSCLILDSPDGFGIQSCRHYSEVK